MNILVPITITDAMIGAGTTIAEPAASETAWVSAGNYVLGDRRIRATTHRVYECVQAHTGRTALPEVDTAYWLDAGPTQRYAPFDTYTNTAATTTTSITYVLSPGYFNAISLYGLTGTQIVVSVKDAPGGTEIYRYPTTGAASLTEPPTGWYDYMFGKRRPIQKLVLSNLPIRPTAELTITVTAATGAAVGIGMINVGDLTPLLGDAEWGGVTGGASAEPTSYSYIKTNDDGTTTIKRRGKSTNLRATVVLPRQKADAALATVQQVLDVPVSWIATTSQGFDGLNVFGIGSCSMSYDSFGIATLQVNVKGLI
ncbi:hypothetical protein C8C99_0328 [Acidovorax sp. 107]|uniref:hypothetical protein n=1 Tax=Acidovorax sp. 107 TaxID=2135638 RepID=UPI000D369130|nr:hypothetical protein [Acidovorax sp. 107]PUA95528.1 hypothetical protein C8C99_0328 [Acidovorax sp. 107]